MFDLVFGSSDPAYGVPSAMYAPYGSISLSGGLFQHYRPVRFGLDASIADA
jgi:hypothetical protein